MLLNEFPEKLIIKTMKEALSERKLERKQENENCLKMFVPYEKGVSEKLSNIAKRFNVQLINKKGKSLKNAVKSKNIVGDVENESSVVYRINCENCEKYYIGETGRMLSVRLKEHKDDGEKGNTEQKISGLSQHIRDTNHQANFNEPIIMMKEKDFCKRKFKEALVIKKNNDSLLNKKEEKKVISNIWENLL